MYADGCAQNILDNNNWDIPCVNELPEGWPGDLSQGLPGTSEWSWWGISFYCTLLLGLLDSLPLRKAKNYGIEE